MRSMLTFSALWLLATPLAAQDLQRPPDWQVRFDQEGASEDDLETFVSMPPGWHVTSGPAAIYWDPAHVAEGTYRLEMDVYLFDPGQRREAFGILVGGHDLDASDQTYTYFLIRNGGEFIVKRRVGIDAPTLHPWTAHAAVRSYADRGEDASVLNRLVVEAGESTVRFLVNGEEVWRAPRVDLSMDGVFGFRVNHGLNLHVARLEAVPLDG